MSDHLTAKEQVRGVQRWMALDLWMALGFGSKEFEPYIEHHGWADTWANLLDAVRGPSVPCAEQTEPGDWCVLRPDHVGPHYGSRDVGPPNDLLRDR